LLADLRSRGIELETDGARLRWRPAFQVPEPLAERIRSHRAELIAVLTGPDRLERCPLCHWPLDSARRCPKCFDRLCVDCGRPTGSYLIKHCVACGHASRNQLEPELPVFALAFTPSFDIYPSVGILQPFRGGHDDMDKRQKTPRTVCDQLRDAIQESGKTHYRVGKDAGIKPEIVTRFVRGQRDITGKTFGKLASAMGLTLVPATEAERKDDHA
jgi:hypothetical protein